MANITQNSVVQCYGMDETNIGGECYERLTLESESTVTDNGWNTANKYGVIRYYCRFHSDQR